MGDDYLNETVTAHAVDPLRRESGTLVGSRLTGTRFLLASDKNSFSASAKLSNDVFCSIRLFAESAAWLLSWCGVSVTFF